MYRATRFSLIASVLLAAYCLAITAALIPFLALLVAVAIVVANKKHQDFDSCGSARWAETRDVRRVGMLRGTNGLMIGQLADSQDKKAAVKGLFLRSLPAKDACETFFAGFRKAPLYHRVFLQRTPHIACIAPTGVGKGTSLIVPFLLTCSESCIVIDIKAGENARLTAEYRRKHFGHQIVLLDPFHQVTQTPDSLNVLDFIDRASPFAIDDCREVAAAMVERKDEKGDGIHFLDNAEGGIAAVAATVVQFAEGKDKSLQSMCDIVSNPTKWALAIELMGGSEAWDGMLARMGGSLAHLRDRELASTMSTIARFLRFLSTPAIAACTRSSSFDPSDVLQGKLTAYLILPPERVSTLSPLLRLWIGAFLRAVVRGGLQEKTKVHFVCDEANSLGRMDQISDALTVGRGAGIRMQLYYQDMGQIKRCWPDGADQTLLANVSQVFFGVNDLETAKYVSERIGKQTLIVSSGGTSTGSSQQYAEQGQGSRSTSTNRNDNWSQQGRELLRPEEVLGLSERMALVFTPGVPPLSTRLLRYYETDFKQEIGTFWPAIKALAEAACLLAAVGIVAVALTLAATAPNHHPQAIRDPPKMVQRPTQGTLSMPP